MKKTTLFAVSIIALNLGLNAQIENIATKPFQHGNREDVLNGTFKPAPHSDGRSEYKAHQAASYVAKYDSAYYWQWDSNSMDWNGNQAYGKNVNYIYDVHNNVLSQTYQGWNGTGWENEYLYSLTYNSSNKTLTNLVQSWNGSAWVNWNIHTYSYDANNNLLTTLYETWNGSAWVNSSLITNTFNANNKILTATNQTWSASAWLNTYLYTYTYDVNNNDIGDVAQSWNGSSWVNDYQYIETFDANNNNTLSLEQAWNGSAWVNSSQSMYTYNANNLQTQDIEQDWSGSTWINSYQYTYNYDANNNDINSLTEIWTGSAWANDYLYLISYNGSHKEIAYNGLSWKGSAWINATYNDYTYDVNNVEQSGASHTYNPAGTKIVSGDSAYYYFTDVLGVNQVKGESENVKVYPCPSSGKFTFQWSAISSQSLVEVYNTVGQKVTGFELTGSTNEIDLSSQPAGIYFYRVVDKTGTLIGNGKLIIQK